MKLQTNDWVQVRTKEEILRSLDKRGQLEGLPFMPQMFQYCGQRFRIFKRAHKTCDTVNPVAGRRVPNAIHLDLRCDGKAHGGCQAACLIFWKEAWLKPINERASSADSLLRGSSGQNGELTNDVSCTEKDVYSADSTRKLAYLVSQYPKVSHSFIRREILALEKQGWQIFRLSIRGWNSELVDPEDISERARTTFVLREGALSLAMALVGQMLRSPLRFFSTVALAVRMVRWSDRPFIWHFFYFAEACWIAPRLKRLGIAHIHAHFSANDAEVAMLVSELAGVSYSVTIHGPDEFDQARWHNLRVKITRAAFVVAISSFARAQIFRMLDHHQWDKVKVVHCGIDATFAKLDAVVPSETNRLVCVGRLCEQKGQLLLVKAIPALVKEGRKFKLVLVGDGEHRDAVEQLIAENNLGEFVTVTGWASAGQVKDEILRARALILPSFAEGLPVVLIEAMTLGRPVLSTYVAGIPELVVDGKTGWLFPAGSEQDMLDAIRACLDTPKEALKVMGELARTRALERHNVSREVEKLASLFESALQERRNARSAGK